MDDSLPPVPFSPHRDHTDVPSSTSNPGGRRGSSFSQPLLHFRAPNDLQSTLENASPDPSTTSNSFQDSRTNKHDTHSERSTGVEANQSEAVDHVDESSKAASHLAPVLPEIESFEPLQDFETGHENTPRAMLHTVQGAKCLHAPRNEEFSQLSRSSKQRQHVPQRAVTTYSSSSRLRTRNIVKRAGTLISPFISKNSNYHKLDDDHVGDIALHGLSTTRNHFNEDLSADAGIDLSSLGGPDFLPRSRNAKSTKVDTNDISLEASGQLTRGLGSGMGRVVETRLARDGTIHKHSATTSIQVADNDESTHIDVPRRLMSHAGQQAALEIGQIIVVEEPVEPFDLSHVAGQHMAHHTSTDPNLMPKTTKESYYFPPDPKMPNWRPFPMRLWWIILQISVAIIFFVIQEWLCRLSMSRGSNGGILTFTSPRDISGFEFFVWKYLPTILLVVYGVMWQTTDFEVRRLEPYYQLSKPTGALAEESLNVEYLTFWSYLIPWKAFRFKHWAVFFSSIGTILASSILPVLQNASVNLYPQLSDRHVSEPKYVRVDPVWSRIMETILLMVAISGVLLIFQLRRMSGLLSDPKGIAGIAAMATRSHILTEFGDLDSSPTNAISQQLQNRRYILHKSSLWQGECIKHQPSSITNDALGKAQNPHSVILRLAAGIPYVSSLLICVIMLPVVLFTPANYIVEHAAWVLTAIATLLKIGWTNLEMGIRIIEPFYILSRRHAPPETLTLDYTGTVPGWLAIKAGFKGHYLMALVGLGSILCEILTVCAASFNVDGKSFASPPQDSETDSVGHSNANDTAETPHSFWASFVLSIFILIALSIIASLVYARRRHAFLPRQPGTIAGVLAYIHQSKMLYDFVATYEQEDTGIRIEEMSSEAMTNHLKAIGKTYGLGWYRGRDGEDHLGVDEEELQAGYTHGEDWRKGRLGKGDWSAWETY